MLQVKIIVGMVSKSTKEVVLNRIRFLEYSDDGFDDFNEEEVLNSPVRPKLNAAFAKGESMKGLIAWTTPK
jgi:hypothetical protein